MGLVEERVVFGHTSQQRTTTWATCAFCRGLPTPKPRAWPVCASAFQAVPLEWLAWLVFFSCVPAPRAKTYGYGTLLQGAEQGERGMAGTLVSPPPPMHGEATGSPAPTPSRRRVRTWLDSWGCHYPLEPITLLTSGQGPCIPPWREMDDCSVPWVVRGRVNRLTPLEGK